MLKEFSSVEISHQKKDAKDFNDDTQYKEFLSEVSLYFVYDYHYQVDNLSLFTASRGQVQNSIEAKSSNGPDVSSFL